MDKKRKFLLTLFLMGFLFSPCAQADETALFTTLAPDALIVLDLSGSMNWTPVGKWMYTVDGGDCNSSSNAFYGESAAGHTKACEIPSSGDIPKYGDSACAGPFYRTSGSGHTRNCTRLAIAKKALFDVLDDNQSNTVTSADENSLGIRIGYMRFWECSNNEPDESYTSGCNKLIWGLGSKYSRIYCNKSTSCASSDSVSGSISGETATGGTPLAVALHEAKVYLDYHKSTDTAADCRQKFAILITDGADTFACGGNGNESQTDMYKRRRETVAKAKALADAGYKTFVVGFGTSMPHFARNTLNWAAYYGGTDNPLVENSGDPGAYVPSAISCEDSATAPHNEGDGEHYYATAFDPGEISLVGYAFLAGNADDLTTALKAAINILRESTFSFSLTSVASSRTQDENNIYEASFEPITGDPFWHGHLKKYDIASNGNVGDVVWDAGFVLQSRSADDRNIKTYLSGGVVSFTKDNLSNTILGVSTPAVRDSVVGFFRGDSTYNKEGWKMGDIFRSNPITIGTPSISFQDTRDQSKAFESFRANHERTSLNTKRVILVGANDGQIHAFRTSDGREIWSFIPPNLLPKLKNVAHSTHPTGLSHQYFVDGPVSIADAWMGSGTGTSKSSGDWKTLMIFGEGRGGSPNLWSSSSSCDSGFNSMYTSAYPYYCGYYAFDYTDTAIDPVYKWRLNPTSAQAPYLGEPWSKVVIGRVKVDGNEEWVGFFGGGYNGSDCSGGGECDTRGKGFYVVKLSTGNILWSYTLADSSSTMNYSLPTQPAIVDTDNDGFIDTVYLGDLGGNMWRFKFCTADQANCGTANWAGGLLYDSSSGTIRPIYTAATVARDRFGHLWVYWGTGDKTDPTAANAQEKFFSMKDDSRAGTYTISNFENITTGSYTDDPAKRGWYINLAGQGEKILAEPTVFGGVVYYTSYTPPHGGSPCEQAGTGSLYGIDYLTGAGVLTISGDGGGAGGGGAVTTYRSLTVGAGIPTAPVISFKPGGALPPDLYVTVSGGAGISVSTQRVDFNPPTLVNRTNLLHWRDERVQ